MMNELAVEEAWLENFIISVKTDTMLNNIERKIIITVVKEAMERLQKEKSLSLKSTPKRKQS